ncbi:GtrA family protein [Starkeya sp. ORNL1]|uniref:GtrA family protein n=1 Tax=Starkeya sp. ORNL1 TaxID=2709380 RepID=UPI0014641D1C|nr:GtrA family protein [Starkeya sp. ORNL1]QJP16157.1 GtrA family protein [Starkeya sp. ORNL1]
MKVRALLSTNMFRFLVVVVFGLCMDLSVAWSLANFAGIPLVYAATGGFLLAALFNYVLNELWTFADENCHLSFKRALLYVLPMLVTLSSRLLLVFLLSPYGTGRVSSLAILIAAASLSFVVNYCLSRFVVYRRTIGPTGSYATSQQ